MPCEIPELAIKLITAVGISEYYKHKRKGSNAIVIGKCVPLELLHGGISHQMRFFFFRIPNLFWKI